MLWQGAPAVLPLAVQALHLRKLAVYFGLLMAWRAAGVLADGGSLLEAARALAWAVPMSALGLGLVFGLGWLYASTTVYTLTNKRVVLRLGIVLTVTFNLPLARIEGVTLRRHSDGTGDLMLRLPDTERIAFLHLWPHVRPWRINRTEPMLRALADIDVVAPLLASALQATLDETARGAQAAAAVCRARCSGLHHSSVNCSSASSACVSCACRSPFSVKTDWSVLPWTRPSAFQVLCPCLTCGGVITRTGTGCERAAGAGARQDDGDRVGEDRQRRRRRVDTVVLRQRLAGRERTSTGTALRDCGRPQRGEDAYS
jgi:hypothetical protein